MTQQVSVGSVSYVLAGTVAPTVAVDRTFDLTAKLFAAFPADAFPARLDRLKLIQLLSEPLPVKIPVPHMHYSDYEPLYPELFELDDSTKALQLFDRLVEALRKPWPDGPPSELLYSGFWDSVGYGLPEFAGKMLDFDAIVSRWVPGSLLLCLFSSAGLALVFDEDVLKAMIQELLHMCAVRFITRRGFAATHSQERG